MTDLLLPLTALALLLIAGWYAAGQVLPDATTGLEKTLSALLLALAYATVAATGLSEVGFFGRGSILAALAMGVLLAWLLHRRRPPASLCQAWSLWSLWPSRSYSFAPLLVAALALSIAFAAAWTLPVWQWDSLGYHLPFVNFVLQRGARADVPALIPYISTYPHNIEYLFLILRALLPNDDLVDIGQIPLGVVGALATAGIALRLGAKREHCLAAGALWLTLPAVFLQLPTNYVDVGSAAYLLLATFWLLTPSSRPDALRAFLLAALALGLYLGSKPSAPLPTIVIMAALMPRLWNAGRALAMAAGAALIVAFGAESYLRNFVATGNPVWPIAVNFGPLQLHGERSVAKLVAAGAAAPRPHGGFFARIFESWTTLQGPHSFDMRLGGFGPVVLFFALPLAVFGMKTRARYVGWTACLLWGAAVLASLAHPEPSTARFVLAWPALLLALAVACLRPWRPALGVAALTVTSLLAAWSLWHAYPAFKPDNDFYLSQVGSQSREALRNSIGADGPPLKWHAFTGGLGASDVIAYDESFTLPGLLWNRNLSNTVLALPWGLDAQSLTKLLQARGVNYLVAGRTLPAGQLMLQRAVGASHLFACGSDPCDVFRLARQP